MPKDIRKKMSEYLDIQEKINVVFTKSNFPYHIEDDILQYLDIEKIYCRRMCEIVKSTDYRMKRGEILGKYYQKIDHFKIKDKNFNLPLYLGYYYATSDYQPTRVEVNKNLITFYYNPPSFWEPYFFTIEKTEDFEKRLYDTHIRELSQAIKIRRGTPFIEVEQVLNKVIKRFENLHLRRDIKEIKKLIKNQNIDSYDRAKELLLSVVDFNEYMERFRDTWDDYNLFLNENQLSPLQKFNIFVKHY